MAEEPRGTPTNQKQEDQQAGPQGGAAAFQEPVWTYRGYRLRGGEFTTAMVHLFRAEVQRANIWRQRLDTTTNWAVVATGAAISFVFTQVESPHVVMPLNIILVTLFLTIEARRYRYYELWSYRVRLMETDFFASMLVPPFHPSPEWSEALAENLLHPHFPISTLEAFGRRLRRNYLWIYAVIGGAWMAKLWLFPFVAASLNQFVQRAAIGTLPGQLVLLIALLYYAGLILISLATVGLQQSAGEVLPRYGALADSIAARLAATGRTAAGMRAWYRPTRQRQQLLTFIITDRAQLVADRILKDMGRGVTSLSGTGMYTGASHSVLMIALRVTEVPQLKALVSEEDPNAFVVVSPAQEVFGKGFTPLEEE